MKKTATVTDNYDENFDFECEFEDDFENEVDDRYTIEPGTLCEFCGEALATCSDEYDDYCEECYNNAYGSLIFG